MTWTSPGVLENNVFRSDPVLGSDETGQFLSISAFCKHSLTICGARSTVARSLTRLTFGDVTGGDKQWFTVDNHQ